MTMIDVDDLAQIIRQVDGNHDLGAGALAEAILDRLPSPQIIRTVEELETLDPETPLWSKNAGYLDVAEFLNAIEYDVDYADDLPAVVIATATHVRVAREALEEA